MPSELLVSDSLGSSPILKLIARQVELGNELWISYEALHTLVDLPAGHLRLLLLLLLCLILGGRTLQQSVVVVCCVLLLVEVVID